jgi:hypothetical protein
VLHLKLINMPICLLYTNLKRSDIDVNLEEKVARCISETLNRPFEVGVRIYLVLKNMYK